jgi:glucose/arabinose dehydrogenase
MRVWPPHSSTRWVSLAIAMASLLVACGTQPETRPSGRTSAVAPAPASETPAGVVSVTVDVPAAFRQAPFDEPRQALIPAGWTMAVWARVPKARLAAWTPDGALLVSDPSGGRVWRLTNEDKSAILLDGLEQPHGLAFAGSTLYVAESDQIAAYDYANGAAINQRVIEPGLPDAKSPELQGEYAHALKSVTIGGDGAVYFSIGSTGNISAEDRVANPPRATVMRIPPGGGQAQVFATGVRNGTGLATAPDGSLWTAVNNRDQIAFPFDLPYAGDSALGQVIGEYVNDHPPESVARLTPGRELGWPFCNPDADVKPGVAGSPQKPDNVPFDRDVQTNAVGSKMDCSALPPVEQSLGAHSAPLGLSFVNGGLPAPYDRGALVGVHGSWNRNPPRAPEVAFFPWLDGTLGNQQTLVGGFQSADGSRWGRPVAAVAGPDGAVYITDDYAGAVYRLSPPGR